MAKALSQTIDAVREIMAPFEHHGWRLYAKDMKLRHRPKMTVYFFSKKTPKLGKPVKKLPVGHSVAVDGYTGLPYVYNELLGAGESAPPSMDRKLRRLKRSEFEKWVSRILGNDAMKRHGGSRGIDGWLKDGRPFRAAGPASVSSSTIRAFALAIARECRKQGVIIALTIGVKAWKEIERVERNDGVDLKLWTVEDLLSKPSLAIR